MNKAKPKIADPSIDDMLTSIRDAIHEETAREAEEHARTFKPRAEPRHVPPAQRAAPSVQTSSPVPAPPPPVKSRASAVSGSMRELRVSLQPAGQANTRGTVTARSEDFLSLKNKLASLRESQPVPAGKGSMAGLMGGDVRLEDALARMNTAEQLQRENVTPPRTEVPPPPLPQAEPPMRATIDDAPADQFDADFALEQPVAEHELEQTEAAPKIDIVTEQPAPETFRPMPEPVFEAAPPAPVEPVYEAPEIVAAPLEASMKDLKPPHPLRSRQQHQPR